MPRPVRPLAVLALVLSVALPALAQTSVRVATWNVETVGTPGSVEYEAARDILERIDADVVAIQEVANSSDIANLDELAAVTGYPFVIVPSSNPLGALRNAFISKLPFESSAIHTSFTLSGDAGANDITRLIVEIVVDFDGQVVSFFTEHWKASGGNDDEFRRAVESQRIVQAIDDLDPAGDHYVVLGDVNEEIDEVPGFPLVFTSEPSGLPQSWELGSDLAAVLATTGFPNDPFSYLLDDAGPDMSLLDTLQKDGSDATRPASGRRLDYIIVSDSIAQLSPPSEVYDSADEALPGGLPKSGTPLPGGTSINASDHYLVFMDATFPPLTVCQTDLGFGGPGSMVLELCGDDLTEPGSQATLSLAGAAPSSPVFLPIGLVNDPTPFKGGTLVPFPYLVLVSGISTDGAGTLSLPVSGAGGAAVTLYFQALVQNGPTLEFSNALEVVLGT